MRGDRRPAGGGSLSETPSGTKSALGNLPLLRWATRLQRGTVDLHGRAGAVELSLGGWSLRLLEGPVHLAVDFEGGPEPVLTRLALAANGLVATGYDRVEGTRLVVHTNAMALDDRVLPTSEVLRVGRFAESLLDAIDDVSVEASAEPDGELVMHLGHGVEVMIPAGAALTVKGAATGPASELQLSAPLTVGFGGDGLRLSHEQFRWLTKLAAVRLAQATLHPDGSVALEGRGGRGVDLAMRAPLQKASARLSDLVRRSPNFKRVRKFLKRADEG